MQQGAQKCCWHQLSSRFKVSEYISLCFNCSSLIIKDQSKNEISTIKPPQYSVIQENAIPIFLSIPVRNPYTFLNKREYLNIRTLIVKQMKSFCTNLKLSKKTFFLALDYLDHICSKMVSYKTSDLTQISQFCILLATKFQENREKGMEVKNYVGAAQNNFVKDELFLAQLLDYDLHVFTSYDVLMDILHCGFLFNGEQFSINKMKIIYEKIESMIYMLSESKYYLDMSNKDIAVVIIGLIREILGLEAYSNIIKYIFINDHKSIQNHLYYLKKIKRCFIIKENNNRSCNNSIENINNSNVVRNSLIKENENNNEISI